MRNTYYVNTAFIKTSHFDDRLELANEIVHVVALQVEVILVRHGSSEIAEDGLKQQSRGVALHTIDANKFVLQLIIISYTFDCI